MYEKSTFGWFETGWYEIAFESTNGIDVTTVFCVGVCLLFTLGIYNVHRYTQWKYFCCLLKSLAAWGVRKLQMYKMYRYLNVEMKVEKQLKLFVS